MVGTSSVESVRARCQRADQPCRSTVQLHHRHLGLTGATDVVQRPARQLQAVASGDGRSTPDGDRGGPTRARVDLPQPADPAVVEDRRTIGELPDPVGVDGRAVTGRPVSTQGEEGRGCAVRPSAGARGMIVRRSTRESVTHTARRVTTRSLRKMPPGTTVSETTRPLRPLTAQTCASVPTLPAAQTSPVRRSQSRPRIWRPFAPGSRTRLVARLRSPVTMRPSASEPT